MHNDIMAAGSKDSPPMLAMGNMLNPPIPEHIVQETYENTLPENRAYIDAEAEAIHMIFSGIRDETYSIVDACKATQEMCRAIERLQNKNVDSSTRTGNDRYIGQFGNKWTVTVAGARETVKDYSYHKERMMLCKQEEKGVPLSVERSDWLQDTDEESDEQELEAHYMCGYIKNHKRIVKNRQARTRESEEYKKKPKN
ncbi:hypothetical protein Tco_0336543 [Tanacetum coccineum]